MNTSESPSFHQRLKGSFQGALHWHQLDALWQRVGQGAWFFYQVGEALPSAPLSGAELRERLVALDALLRQEHDCDYCGIVYADDLEQPTLIKVYDPGQIGSSCSHNIAPAPPGWILSTTPPAQVSLNAPVPNARRRWWQRLLR